MLEQTFHTPLPLDLEVGIPSGDIEIETAEGEESHVTVDGDERLLEEVEIPRTAIVSSSRTAARASSASHSLRSQSSSATAICACGPESRTARESRSRRRRRDTRLEGHFGELDVNSVSGRRPRCDGEVADDANIKTVSGDARIERVEGDMTAQTVSGDLRIGPVTRLRGDEDGVGRHSLRGASPQETSASRASPATSRSASPRARSSTSTRARPRATSRRRFRSPASRSRRRGSGRLRRSSSAVARSAATSGSSAQV